MLRKLVGLLTIAVAGLFWVGSAFAGTIENSAHDWSALGWAGGEVCVVCHTPHNAAGTDGPLWNRTNYDASVPAFVMYPDTATIDGTIDTDPTGTSVICLSCHEGSLFVDSFGGGPATPDQTVALIGGDSDAVVVLNLSNDHPISITYVPGTGAGQDAELAATTASVTFGNGATGTVADLLDTGAKVQCSSCHDVHNTQNNGTEAGLLRIDNTGANGSDLCLSCHAK